MKTELVKTYYKIKSHLPISGSYENLAALETGKTRVVVFHGFDTNGSTKYNYKYTSLNRFQALIKALSNYVNFISLQEFAAREIAHNRMNVLLVCDDGFLNNLSILPIIEHLAVPITLFISTNQLRNKTCLWPDLIDLSGHFGPSTITMGQKTFYNKNRRYISKDGVNLKKYLITGTLSEIQHLEEELKEINIPENLRSTYLNILSTEDLKELGKNPQVSLGSHGVTHTNFKSLSAEQLVNELTTSKQFLENITDTQINALAFPFSLYGAREVALAKSAGYNLLFGEHDLIENQVIPRITVNPFSSLSNQVKAILKGKY